MQAKVYDEKGINKKCISFLDFIESHFWDTPKKNKFIEYLNIKTWSKM